MADVEPDFSIKANDRRPVFRAQLGYRRADGTFVPVDLTDALDVYFIMRLDSPGTLAPAVNSRATVEDPQAGIVVYNWAIGDTSLPGNYRGEWEVHWPDDPDVITETFPTKSYHAIEVIGDLDSEA